MKREAFQQFMSQDPIPDQPGMVRLVLQWDVTHETALEIFRLIQDMDRDRDPAA